MEKSCGAVVFLEGNEGRRYLILHYEKGHWDFPKGHVEKGETEEGTARREIVEETGITRLEFLPGFREGIFYSFLRGGKKIGKEVLFFLVKTDEENVTLSSEHVGAAWLSYGDAMKRLTYGGAKGLLLKAEAFLLKKPGQLSK